MQDQLIKGNNFELLDDFDCCIDCTITSPPYNKKEKKNSGKITNAVIYDNYCDSLPENEYQEKQIELLNKIYSVTKIGGHCFYNHKVRYDDGEAISPFEWLNETDWSIRQEIVWDRIIASNIRGWRFWNIDERIYWLYKKTNDKDKGTELNSQWAKMSSIWRFSPEKGIKEHPAPFPKELPRRIIKSLYKDNTNKVIFDPYVGSGTTAVVAKELGHHYIGIDISEKYLEFAQRRIDETVTNDCSLKELFGN